MKENQKLKQELEDIRKQLEEFKEDIIKEVRLEVQQTLGQDIANEMKKLKADVHAEIIGTGNRDGIPSLYLQLYGGAYERAGG